MRPYFFLLILLSWVACKERRATTKPPTFYKTEANASKSDVKLTRLEADAHARLDGGRGVEWTAWLEIPEDKGLEAKNSEYVLVFSLLKGDTLVHTHARQAYRDTLRFSQKAFVRLFVPYSLLNLHAGKQPLSLMVNGYYHQLPDSLRKEQYVYDLAAKITAEIDMPPVRTFRLVVDYLSMDTLKFNPSDSDFRLWGTGYPDVMLQIKQGGAIQYTTKECKNTLLYCRKDSLPPLYLPAGDSLLFQVYDQDDVSADDLLSQIYLTAEMLQAACQHPLTFGKVKRLYFQPYSEPKVQKSVAKKNKQPKQ